MQILRKCLATLLLLALPLSVAQAEDDKVYKLRLAQSWPANFPIMGDASIIMAERAEKMSNGRLKISIDPANKHKAPFEIFDLVKSGQYDMGHSASYYWKGKVPNTLYFTTMPFGMIAPEQYGWFYHGGGIELMEKVYSPHGLRSYPGGNSTNQMGGWFQKEIKSLEDLKGLKMRIPGFAGEIMAEVGAVPTNIPPGELYTALERNTIDALEWVGPSLDLRMGFQKIAKYYYTGWHEPGAELQFLVNEKKLKSLPEDLQEILQVAIRSAAFDTYIRFYNDNGMELAKLQSEFPDVQIKTFPKDVLDALKAANDKLLAAKSKDDPLAQEILDSQAAYMKKARAWTDISDKAYLQSMQD